MTKFMWLVYFTKMMVCPCINERRDDVKVLGGPKYIQKAGEFPPEINESSGLLYLKSNHLLTHNDSGGRPILYETTIAGSLSGNIDIKNSKNVDWEDLAFDRKNQIIYIADTGNNGLWRKESSIYVLDSTDTHELKFTFENGPQDVEAIYYSADKIHLFSKSQNTKTPVSYHFILAPNEKYSVLKPIETINFNGLVTGADININEETIAVLTYGKTLIYKRKTEGFDFKKPDFCIKTKRKQTEAITFINDNEAIFSNEQRSLYKLKIPSK